MDQEAQGGGAYGAPLAGFVFDPIEFIKRPHVILRIVSLLFSIIVFGCILSGSYLYSNVCLYNGDMNACGYGVWIGIIAFIASLLFLLSDAIFSQISNAQHRRFIVMGDMGFSAFWAFLWFVGFCYLTNKWSNTSGEWLRLLGVKLWMMNNCQAAIAFSFFSIPVWVALTFFAYKRFQEGTEGLFASADDVAEHRVPGSLPGQPYAQDDAPGAEGYQQSKQPPAQQPPSQYQDPLY